MGIVGNEKADELAKFAALKLIPRDCSLPNNDYIPGIKLSIVQAWQFMWELENKKNERDS